MMQDVSAHLTQQFAQSLSAQLSAEPGQTSPVGATKEVRALRLAVWAMLRAVARVLHLPSARRDAASAGQPSDVRPNG